MRRQPVTQLLSPSDTDRNVPESPPAPSTTVTVQSPLATPVRVDDSTDSGAQLPVKGASADVAVENARPAPSAKRTWHRLLPLPPEPLKTTAVVPSGAVTVAVRSPTQVWSMPTVVAPSAVVHSVPSTETAKAPARPTPETGIVTLAPAISSSGIGRAGPAYLKTTSGASTPTGTESTPVVGESVPTKVTRALSSTGRPSSHVGGMVSVNVADLDWPTGTLPMVRDRGVTLAPATLGVSVTETPVARKSPELVTGTVSWALSPGSRMASPSEVETMLAWPMTTQG